MRRRPCGSSAAIRRIMMTILETKDLSKRFGTNAALDKVSISVESGKITGLLGPNGSGKTTLLKIAAGLLYPTAGSCLIDGKAPGKATKALVAFLPDRISLPEWMNTAKLFDYLGDFYADFDREKAERMTGELGLDPKQSLKHMSKGTREKLQLITVMSRSAKLYLLDEPLSGVDPATRDYILNTIITNYNPDAAVVISTHLIADIENVLDDVIFISKGGIVLSSSVDQIREEHGKSVDEYFREVFAI